MTVPDMYLLDKAPWALPIAEADAWHRHMRACRRQMARVIYGPKAPPRKRPRRVAKKIARRGGMLRCRGPVQDVLVAIGKAFPGVL